MSVTKKSTAASHTSSKSKSSSPSKEVKKSEGSGSGSGKEREISSSNAVKKGASISKSHSGKNKSDVKLMISEDDIGNVTIMMEEPYGKVVGSERGSTTASASTEVNRSSTSIPSTKPVATTKSGSPTSSKDLPGKQFKATTETKAKTNKTPSNDKKKTGSNTNNNSSGRRAKKVKEKKEVEILTRKEIREGFKRMSEYYGDESHKSRKNMARFFKGGMTKGDIERTKAFLLAEAARKASFSRIQKPPLSDNNIIDKDAAREFETHDDNRKSVPITESNNVDGLPANSSSSSLSNMIFSQSEEIGNELGDGKKVDLDSDSKVFAEEVKTKSTKTSSRTRSGSQDKKTGGAPWQMEDTAANKFPLSQGKSLTSNVREQKTTKLKSNVSRKLVLNSCGGEMITVEVDKVYDADGEDTVWNEKRKYKKSRAVLEQTKLHSKKKIKTKSAIFVAGKKRKVLISFVRKILLASALATIFFFFLLKLYEFIFFTWELFTALPSSIILVRSNATVTCLPDFQSISIVSFKIVEALDVS